MANYAPYSSESSTLNSFFLDGTPVGFDPRVSRNFDELVSQRQEHTESNCSQFYNSVFENIKEKIFIVSESDDIEITNDEIKQYQLKYNDESVLEAVSTLKQQIAELYLKKTEHELLVEEKRRIYKSFCNNVESHLNSISEISDDPEDTQLKELLNNRINWYYQKLDLDNLINTENELKKELTFLKKTIKQFVKISPTICSICMEHEIAWFIDPCGHTMCASCKTNVEKSKKCHYCRTEKTKLNRLYL